MRLILYAFTRLKTVLEGFGLVSTLPFIHKISFKAYLNQLVDRISASLPSKRRLYLRTDHSGLNKYHSANDGNFLLVQSELSRMVKAAPETLERQYNCKIIIFMFEFKLVCSLISSKHTDRRSEIISFV